MRLYKQRSVAAVRASGKMKRSADAMMMPLLQTEQPHRPAKVQKAEPPPPGGVWGGMLSGMRAHFEGEYHT